MNLKTITTALSLCAAIALGACVSENKYAERSAETFCEKARECTPDAVADDCEDELTAVYQDVADMCEDYDARLAYKCLKDVEKAECDADTPQTCLDFDEKCGIDANTANLEYDGGLVVYSIYKMERLPVSAD